MPRKTTVLSATAIAKIAQQVLDLSDPPSTSTVSELKTYANVATSFLNEKVDAKGLKPFLDAIDVKIESFGVSRTNWAVAFAAAVTRHAPPRHRVVANAQSDQRAAASN